MKIVTVEVCAQEARAEQDAGIYCLKRAYQHHDCFFRKTTSLQKPRGAATTTTIPISQNNTFPLTEKHEEKNRR